MTPYCTDQMRRDWVLGPGACDGDYEHCKHVVKIGKQEYCGFVPGRCALHQVIRSQAGCLWCKWSTKDIDSAKCLPCLSADERINFEREDDGK